MTNFIAFGTPYVKLYVIYLHVCIFIHQTEMVLCNIMLIVLLEWSLWAFGSEITPVSRNQHYESFDVENSLWYRVLPPAEGHLVITASKYWIPAALSIFWNKNASTHNLQKTRCLSHSTRNFFVLTCFLICICSGKHESHKSTDLVLNLSIFHDITVCDP